MVFYKPIFLLAAALTFCLSCNHSAVSAAEYDAAVKEGRKSIPAVFEMESLFTNVHSFITHFNIRNGKRVWNSEVFLYDRYVLTMQVDIEFDPSDTKIVKQGDLLFVLVEVESVRERPSGQQEINYTKNQKTFGIDEWKTLVESHGDFAKIGYTMEKIKPVPNFDVVKNPN